MSLNFDSARLFNPHLRPEHEEWRTQLRKWLEKEVVPFLDDWEEAGKIPEELWRKAADIGVMQMGYPEAYGGISEGIDQWHINITNEEFTRAGSAGGLISNLLIHGIGLPPVINYGSEALKQMVAPSVLAGEKRISLGITEPSGGSDVANITTTAVRDGDYYIVSGSKTFISGVMNADWVSTAVRTGGEGGRGVSMLLIPTDLAGVARTPLDRKQGWWCADTGTIYFDNVRVPAENLLGEEGQGFWVIMTNFNPERLSLAVTMEAAARACLEDAVEWAQQRKTFGKRLADHQVIRHKIATMKQKINATQTYLQYLTQAYIDGRCDPGDLAMAKVQASETMEYCAREASQILGGASYLRGNRVERFYREVRVNAIGGGSEEIMRDLAARQYQL
ncbi:acyl-CoA dehydrogenase family protein [Zhongshania aliphaticivorans]|uniref:acyl-CoA dehydrogenase family protein n=1 Tax=Zhongshania aliphaticivorans TaxID=1470434 RepID=UPI0012E674D6|nr:acyl-CoA dehydrogenase family protein [Zhongshania aliphaticivorans]CAA0080318.1 Glutaryl-CoA dehydrogenase [Zhongshania aliphaticivorans]